MEKQQRRAGSDRRAYRVNEFAEAYRVSRPTIYRMLKAGTIVSVKVGSRTLIPIESAEQWWNAQASKRG